MPKKAGSLNSRRTIEPSCPRGPEATPAAGALVRHPRLLPLGGHGSTFNASYVRIEASFSAGVSPPFPARRPPGRDHQRFLTERFRVPSAGSIHPPRLSCNHFLSPVTISDSPTPLV